MSHPGHQGELFDELTDFLETNAGQDSSQFDATQVAQWTRFAAGIDRDLTEIRGAFGRGENVVGDAAENVFPVGFASIGTPQNPRLPTPAPERSLSERLGQKQGPPSLPPDADPEPTAGPPSVESDDDRGFFGTIAARAKTDFGPGPGSLADRAAAGIESAAKGAFKFLGGGSSGDEDAFICEKSHVLSL